MLTPIVKTIETPCGQETAFRIFVHEMDSWWPLAKFTTSAMRGGPAKLIRVDAEIGGKICEVAKDGAEFEWGEIVQYKPNELVSMTFHIPHPQHQSDERSLLEMQFEPLNEQNTRVQLTQTNWETFGENAEMIRAGYDHGWDIIFSYEYKMRCLKATN